MIKETVKFLAILAVILITGVLGQAYAADILPIGGGLCNYFPCPSGDTGVDMAKSLAGRIVDNVRYVVGAVAVLMIVVSGVRLIIAQGNEEDYKKHEETLYYAIIGLFFIGLAGDLANILEVDRGGFLKDPNVMVQKSKLFTRTTEIIITFMKYVLGSMAVLYIIRNGLRLVLMGGNDEEVAKDKKDIFYGLLGLVIVMIANPIINKVFFKIDTGQFPGIEPVRPGIDTKALLKEIVGMTNVVAAITGPFALISLVTGALMYTFGAGDEEQTGKAKKIIIWSIFGIVIIYGSFAIVSTFVARQFEGI